MDLGIKGAAFSRTATELLSNIVMFGVMIVIYYLKLRSPNVAERFWSGFISDSLDNGGLFLK